VLSHLRDFHNFLYRGPSESSINVYKNRHTGKIYQLIFDPDLYEGIIDVDSGPLRLVDHAYLG